MSELTDKEKLENLLLAIDKMWHAIEPHKIHSCSNFKKVWDLYSEYGGRELASKKFWEFVKQTSEEVRKWPSWMRERQ